MGLQQFGNDAGVDVIIICVHRHFLARLQNLGGDAGIEDGRHLEFPGQKRHMAGGAAGVGNDGRGLGHNRYIFGGSVPGHQDCSRWKISEVIIPPHQHHGTRANAAASDAALIQQYRILSQSSGLALRGSFDRYLQLTALQEPEPVLKVQGPFHILGPLIMGLQGGRPLRQLL